MVERADVDAERGGRGEGVERGGGDRLCTRALIEWVLRGRPRKQPHERGHRILLCEEHRTERLEVFQWEEVGLIGAAALACDADQPA